MVFSTVLFVTSRNQESVEYSYLGFYAPAYYAGFSGDINNAYLNELHLEFDNGEVLTSTDKSLINNDSSNNFVDVYGSLNGNSLNGDGMLDQITDNVPATQTAWSLPNSTYSDPRESEQYANKLLFAIRVDKSKIENAKLSLGNYWSGVTDASQTLNSQRIDNMMLYVTEEDPRTMSDVHNIANGNWTYIGQLNRFYANQSYQTTDKVHSEKSGWTLFQNFGTTDYVDDGTHGSVDVDYYSDVGRDPKKIGTLTSASEMNTYFEDTLGLWYRDVRANVLTTHGSDNISYGATGSVDSGVVGYIEDKNITEIEIKFGCDTYYHNHDITRVSLYRNDERVYVDYYDLSSGGGSNVVRMPLYDNNGNNYRWEISQNLSRVQNFNINIFYILYNFETSDKIASQSHGDDWKLFQNFGTEGTYNIGRNVDTTYYATDGRTPLSLTGSFADGLTYMENKLGITNNNSNGSILYDGIDFHSTSLSEPARVEMPITDANVLDIEICMASRCATPREPGGSGYNHSKCILYKNDVEQEVKIIRDFSDEEREYATSIFSIPDNDGTNYKIRIEEGLASRNTVLINYILFRHRPVPFSYLTLKRASMEGIPTPLADANSVSLNSTPVFTDSGSSGDRIGSQSSISYDGSRAVTITSIANTWFTQTFNTSVSSISLQGNDYARIYEKVGGVWSQVIDLTGKGYANTIKVSGDGNYVFVTKHGQNIVDVYEWGLWNNPSSTIVCPDGGSTDFGFSLDCDYTGTYLIVGSPSTNKVYRYVRQDDIYNTEVYTRWGLLGTTSGTTGQKLGFAVAISGNGKAFMASDPYYDSDKGSYMTGVFETGQVVANYLNIYTATGIGFSVSLNYDGTKGNWSQIYTHYQNNTGTIRYNVRNDIYSQWSYGNGQVIHGSVGNGYLGWAVSMDYQGSFVSMARGAQVQNGVAQLYIKKTSTTQATTNLGTFTINGDTNENLGSERGLTLSGDGKTLMLSSSTPNGGDTGVVKFYELIYS